MSTISAGTSVGTALVNTGDTTGALVFKTNTNTTALTLDASGNAIFPFDVNITGIVINQDMRNKLYFFSGF